jgi:YD repeat-containing protein
VGVVPRISGLQVSETGASTSGGSDAGLDPVDQERPLELGHHRHDVQQELAALPSTTYSYDLDRFLTSITRPDGVVVTHVPDAFERLSQITYPQGSIGYAYDPSTGLLHSTTAPSGEATTFAYDGLLRKSITCRGLDRLRIQF